MSDLTALDFINAGKEGTFVDSGKTKTSATQVDELFKYLEEKEMEKLVVYFHGGLVSEKDGLQAAQVMKDNFTSLTEKRHALSFVWETGPKEIVTQNFADIIKKSGSPFYREALDFVIKLVGKRLGIKDTKGGGGEYLSDSTIAIEKQKPFPFEDLDKQMEGTKGGPGELSIEPHEEREVLAKLERESQQLIKAQATEEFKETTTADDPDLTPELAAGEDDDDSKGFGAIGVIKVVAQIAFNVLKRYFKNTHHDFYPTVVEETFRKLYIGSIGTWGWGSIKNKADKMFADNTGLSGDGLHTGTYFLDKLEAHYKSRIAAHKDFTIHLIGHSAGSIVICALLKTSLEKHPDLKFGTVFFLAPACRTDLFLSHAVPAKDAGVFNKFRMFTMKAENEKKDHCIPYVYTHSLLYMVSGLFEKDANDAGETDAKIMGLSEQYPATGRYADFDELKKLNRFLSDHSVILSDDNINDDLSLRCTALKHGDFDGDVPTLTSILKAM